jgi:sulfoquinovose isomerase
MTSWDAGSRRQEAQSLLEFGRRFPHPLGGAAWLGDDGAPMLDRPVYTYATARMAHVYSLAHLMGDRGAGDLADAALAGLAGRLRDPRHGGWHTYVDPEGVAPDEKSSYTHAFVVLAGATGAVAGRAGAEDLLAEALETWNARFYDAEFRMYADEWDGAFTRLSAYRGLNANMHAVEALLAAADATGDAQWTQRALDLCRRVAVDLGPRHDWRLPEHFTEQWEPMLEHNRDRPADPFQPYGATVGHGLEWSRLLLHLEAGLGADAPDWLAPASAALFGRAVQDGWAVDGAEGFLYTTDWDGRPVVRDRMHWVLAEGLGAASAQQRRWQEDTFDELAAGWWRYAQEYVIDHELGSWRHQLDADNRPVGTVWPGKPDLYHAFQAMLIPDLPLAPTMAAALRDSQAG